MDQSEAEARQQRDQFLTELRKRGDVPATSDVLWDVYMAALSGLDSVFAKEPGAAKNLAYVVRRVEQYNLRLAEEDPRPKSEAFRKLREVITDA